MDDQKKTIQNEEDKSIVGGSNKNKKTQKEMRDLGIEPRAPRRCSDGNGEFYH